MPPILSPHPRPAPTRMLRASSVAAIAMPHELTCSKIAPRAAISLTSTPRLMSPIELGPSAMAPMPRSSCSPVPRRRTKPYPTPHLRRRSLSRPACHSQPPIHAFDKLPWTAALDAAPTHPDIWDIADLSQLPVPAAPSCVAPASGAGPVRRRRTSLRSNSISNRTAPLSLSSSCSDQRPCTPLCDTPFNVPADTSRPQTPLSRFNPSRVIFRHLMPVLCDPHNDESDHCTFIPALPLHLR
ncbi:hypothetical protein LshimejAT787_0210110 [Lyophyllum shimeji]|uniref:Uncharacterized protein n=1 Tax=Lyophyllum shimeji TaxID=47721 RepID=A0A9P3PH81_LYOSH|nr:hypothetical protein LshimejAT787_0210110 [Lyophyllum shimeji]